MTLSGGWRGRGAHDINGRSARARQKRETKRTTRARVEQREVCGAFCSAFLARARADSVGGGPPACTGRAPGGGGPPPKTLFFVKNKGSPGATKHVFSGSLKNTCHASFCANKTDSVPLPSLGSAKRTSFFALVFYVHKTVQAMTTSPLFFCCPRNMQK